MKLTIAIPTFDRNEILARNLAVLLPLLDESIELLIIDNASPTPCGETLAPLLAKHANLHVRLLRNPANVGGSANLLRCFEEATGDWIWALGDDDLVDPAAIKTLREATATFPESVVVNFYSESKHHPTRTELVQSRGAEEFLARTDSLGAILFISNSVFNRAAMVSHLKTGYNYAYSYAPHLAMLLTALGGDGRAVFSPGSLIAGVRDDTPREKQGNGIGPILGLPTLLELPLSEPARREIKRLLIGAAHSFLTLEGFLSHVTPLARHDRGVFARYLYKTGARRFFKLDPGVGIRLKLLAGAAILSNSRFGFWVVQTIYRRKKGTVITVPETKDFSARA